MNVDNFKIMVAAYINRTATSLVVNGVDILLEAINQAKTAAMRDHDFTCMKTKGFMNLNAFGVDWTTSCYATPVVGSALAVKRVLGAYAYSTFGSNYVKQSRYRMMTEGDYDKNELAEIMDMTQIASPRTDNIIYMSGTNLILSAATTTNAWVWLDTYNYLPDYVAAGAGDWFTIQGRDWLLLKSLQMLNFFLKEDQRVSISNSAVQDRWDSILRLDNNYSNFDGSNALV